jgi:hypothetical protein
VGGPKILRFRLLANALKNLRRINFCDCATGLADQQGCGLAFMGMGASHEGIAAFNLVNQAVGEEKIKGAVDRDGRWARAMFRHAFDNVIGSNGGMALGHGAKNFTALAGQLAAAPLACTLGPCDQIGGAMAVVMVGVKEGHIVII